MFYNGIELQGFFFFPQMALASLFNRLVGDSFIFRENLLIVQTISIPSIPPLTSFPYC